MKRQKRLLELVLTLHIAVSHADAACVSDLDHDGVCDPMDSCPNTIHSVLVDMHGCPPAVSGDLNRDGAVDRDDVMLMNTCMTGPAIPANGSVLCVSADLDFDSDVDMEDFAVLQRCLAGYKHVASPNCANPSAIIVNSQLHILGTGASDRITLRLQAGAPTILQVDFGDDSTTDFSFDRSLFDHILIDAGNGEDVVKIDESGGIFTDTEITTINGGNDNDTLLGGSGNETFNGGFGNDFIDGNRGNDTAFLGEGDDVYNWDPGDGNDIIEGQGGNDTLQFNDANVNENIDISAFGARTHFTRNVANILMDLDGVEQITFHALGGNDNVVVNNLIGTAVLQVNVDLAGTNGGNTGDSAVDTVTIKGTAVADVFNVSGNAGAAEVTGVGPLVRVTTGEATDSIVIQGIGGDIVNMNGSNGSDTISFVAITSSASVLVTSSTFSVPVTVSSIAQLNLNGLDGPDTISGSNGVAALNIPIQIDGGAGDDTILGSDANETIFGGPGNDFIDPNRGNDTVHMGSDNDTMQWDPGDGSDVVEGDAGFDTFQFNGANINEVFDLSASGTRFRFTRDVAAILMDLDGVEQVNIQALGGTDTITVNNLAGTAVTTVNVNLESIVGGGNADGSADTVIVNGTPAADNINIGSNAGAVEVSGLQSLVRIRQADPSKDTLKVNGLEGTDVFNVSPSVFNMILLIVNQ